MKPEDCIGPVDPACTEGGRIDITLTDNHNKRIFIENKINAGDGKNQLRRYHDYDKKAALLYLTLYGTSPSKHSLGAGKDFYVHVISYEKDILQWLLRCRKESAMLPGIREALTQYIELVRHLTNQTARRTMKEEIKQLIVNNPDYIEAIDASWQSLAELKSEAEQNFRGVIEKKLADQVKPIPVNRELSIEVQCAEDGDGFYIGYQLMDGKENKSNSELGQQYAKQLRAIAPNFTRNAWHLGWHNPVGFSRYIRVANLDKQLLVKFYTRDKELDDFAQRIVDQERDIRNALEKAVFPLEVKAITTET